MSRLEALAKIAAKAISGDLVFPTSVAVAARIRDALEDPDLHLSAAVRMIKAEPLLASRCVALANSAVFRRSGQPVTDIATAASRVGIATVRILAHGLIVRQLAGMPADPQRQDLVARLWEHTAHVASLARLLAARVTLINPNMALFAGLVHEVGTFYLISRAVEFPQLLESEHPEEGEGELEVTVHRAVAAALSLPAPIVEALEGVWSGYLASPPETLSDTVMLAKVLTPIKTPFVRLQDSSLIAPVDMQVGEAHLTDILAESSEEVESLTRALAV
jgi:HD-like signal output (HDOD) protein